MANVVEVILKGTDQLSREFSKATDSMVAFQKAAGIAMSVAGTVTLAAGAALGAMVVHAANAAEELGQLAQKTGTSVEFLSGLKVASDIADVSMESMAIGIKKLSEHMAAVQGGNLQAKETFKDLGISITDANGNLLTAQEILPKLADAFQASADGVTKTAAAVTLFGKSGTDLIPLLNQGSAGFAQMQSDAEALGVTLGGETAAEAKLLHDSVKELWLACQGIANQLMIEFVPSIANLATMLVEWVKQSESVRITSSALIATVKTLVIGLRALWDVQMTQITLWRAWFELIFNAAYTLLPAYWEAIKHVTDGIIDFAGHVWDAIKAAGSLGEIISDVAHGHFAEAAEAAKKMGGEMAGSFALAAGSLVSSFSAAGSDMKKGFQDEWTGIKQITNETIDSIKNRWTDALDFSVKVDAGTYKPPNITAPQMPKPQMPVIVNLAELKLAQEQMMKLNELVLTMQMNQMTGAAKLDAEAALAYQKRLDEIIKLTVTEAQKDTAKLEAKKEYQNKLNEIERQGLRIRAEMDQAEKDGDVQRYMAALNSQHAAFMADIQGRQQLMKQWSQFQMESHRSVLSYISDLSKTLYDGISNHLTAAIMGTEKWAAAAKALGQEFVSAIVKMMVQRAAAWAFEQLLAAGARLLGATMAIGAVGQAAAVAGAWAAAASAASIATLGGADSFAASIPEIMTANAMAGSMIAATAGLGGAAHGGLGYVPSETTYLLQKGERVLSPKQNEDFTDFIATQNQRGGQSGAGSAMGQAVTVNLTLDGQILGVALGRLARDGRLTIPMRAVV